ncbi:MAG: hypothetical protein HC915_06640 [Anaerolineae bacterium]|nr:hypothetical protein [Anaerolineae bacterium]
MSIAVRSHVGRDLLQNGAYFNSAPKVVLEYVSNSIDNAPEAQVVRVDVTIDSNEIVIKDNANGMAQEDLMHFFTMHGVNRQRTRGRKVRGRFGTGKSAAFGIADGLRVDTARHGKRNVVELHRNEVLNVEDGSEVPVRHLVQDELTDRPNGTIITIFDLQLDRIFITPVRERLEYALGRHLDKHEVSLNNRRLKYRRPEAVRTFAFVPPQDLLARMPNTGTLHISVARETLAASENGVAVLANGFLNAMTLGEATGKPYTQRIFGELDAPDLDDERDDEHFPAFDNTRDLSLNPQNPRAALVLAWISASVEQVRQELDIEAALDRLSEVTTQMQNAADVVSELINADFARVQKRLKVVAQHAVETSSIGSSDVVEVVHDATPLIDEGALAEYSPLRSTPPVPASSSLPPLDYAQPDEPDAEPVPFQAPPTPALETEATPDEAYSAFVQYMRELDRAEEEAYFEALLEEASTLPLEERRQVVQEVLAEPLLPPTQPESLSQAAPVEETIHRKYVTSEHKVLLTPRGSDLQTASTVEAAETYQDEWVVDRESFVQGKGHGTTAPQPDAPTRKFKKPQRRTYFHINFEHMGQEKPRARYAEDARTIYVNRDHPQIVHIEQAEGIESLAYKNLLSEIVIQEYASAVVRQMASTGFYVADPFDAVETIQAVVNRLAREAAGRMLTQAGEEAGSGDAIDED